MARADMPLPCRIGVKDIPVLKGLAAAFPEGDSPNPYQQIIEAIETSGGDIDLWAES
jgi:hypothetical protein